MFDHPRLPKEPPVTPKNASATRSARSSTLPSQQAPDLKHRHRHRHHQSTSYRPGHSYRVSTDGGTHSSPTGSHASPLSPLGELLNPVKRNVTEGLSGVAGWIDRDKEKERGRGLPEGKENVPEQPKVDPKELVEGKRKRKAAQRSVEEHYNKVAAQALAQHATLADSRINMLRMLSSLGSTLSSLSKIRAETDALLENLTQESIPEITEESTRQLENFRATISDMETNRITKLQARVAKARESTTKLGNRMVEVRSRIKAWEEQEVEEDKRRRRRVGIVWGTIAVMLVLVVLLLIWGRMNEQLEALEDPLQDWTEIAIEKEKNRTGTNESELAMEELFKSLHEDDSGRSGHLNQKLPGEDTNTEQDDGLLSRIFDEL